jgi:thiol-disulfide isomerase/thioredoxin
MPRLPAACAALLAAACATARPVKEVGAPAPSIVVDHWLRGLPFDPTERGHVQVLEFWATFCGPCRVTAPHLTALQRKYLDRGVRVVGVTTEPADVARRFVRQMGDRMRYYVAADLGRTTWDLYMEPLGVRTIPYAFVTGRDGALLWHGHPLMGLDEALDQIVAGSYDLERARRLHLAKRGIQEYRERAAEGEAAAALAARATTLLREAEGDPWTLTELAEVILSSGAPAGRDRPLALRAATAADGLSNDPAVSRVFAWALFENGDGARAAEVVDAALDRAGAHWARAALERDARRYRPAGP